MKHSRIHQFSIPFTNNNNVFFYSSIHKKPNPLTIGSPKGRCYTLGKLMGNRCPSKESVAKSTQISALVVCSKSLYCNFSVPPFHLTPTLKQCRRLTINPVPLFPLMSPHWTPSSIKASSQTQQPPMITLINLKF